MSETIVKKKIEFSPEQQRAIEHSKGHIGIIACPGSGKTEVVSRRVANLIKNGEDPETIVSFTFTEKAADELKFRIRKILEETCPERSDFGDMYVGTIHSFCLRLIKELDPNYRSYDVLNDGMRVAYVTKQQNFYGNIRMTKLKEIVGSTYKTATRFLNTADIITNEGVDLDSIKKNDTHDKFKKVYKRYQKQLNDDKYFDFGTVIEETVHILKQDKTKREKLGKLIKHLTVDEYQDVNSMQESLVEIVSEYAESVCVVGDDDQNIYHWRGSNVGNILNFEKKYSAKKFDVTTEKLVTNYRSTAEIIEMSRGFIEYNNKRLGKAMRHNPKTTRKHEQGDIIYKNFDTEEEEFEFIYKKIMELKDSDHTDKRGPHSISLGDIAILVRTNNDAARILAFLSDKKGLDCVAYSGKSIFERDEVLLATDCISYVFGCPGYTNIVKKNLSSPPAPTLKEIRDLYEHTFPKQRFADADPDKFAEKMKEIKEVADKVRDKPGVEAVSSKGRKYISPRDYLPERGLQLFYQNILNAMGGERFDFGKVYNYNLAVLSSAISDYELVYTRLRHKNIQQFPWFIRAFGQSHYSDNSHNDPTIQDAVNVLTIHKAKGLEFPVVFMPCFNQRPSSRKTPNFLDDDEYNVEMYTGTDEDVRRTVYVAMTRSEKYLAITSSELREGTVRKKKPHWCLAEIPTKYISDQLYGKRKKNGLAPKVSADGTFPTSFSQLNSYERCPKDYQMRHIYGYNAGVPAQFGYGTNIHNMLNIIFNEYLESKKIPTAAEISKRFAKMWTMRYATEAMSENARKKAEGIIKKYVTMHSSDFDRVLKTEKNFEFALGSALISGQIDLLLKVDQTNKVTDVEIIDFKSGEKRDGEYQADHEKQLRYYAIACRESLDLDPQRAFVHHLSEANSAKAKTEIDISDKFLDQTRNHIETQVDSVIRREYPASPKKQEDTCKGCDYKRICAEKGFNVGIDFEKD